MGIDYSLLCSEVCKIDTNILGAWIVNHSAKIESYVKPGNPIPKPSELERIFFQSRLIISMVQSNEQMYGKTQSVTIRHKKIDTILLPIGDKELLAVSCAKPYDEKKILDRIEKPLVEI